MVNSLAKKRPGPKSPLLPVQQLLPVGPILTQLLQWTNKYLITIIATASNDDFRPTRRVRTAPGGATHNIFGGDEDDDALSLAPPRGPTTVTEQNAPTNTIANEPESDRPAFKPSRRVREMPGGRDSIADVSVLCSESISGRC